MSIQVESITKSFDGFVALDNVCLEVKPGELLGLLGPSGSGKTTLLRIIAGLELADPGSGRILFHGEDVTRVRAGQRQVGFVFQHYALFRHLTVFDNVAFGLQVRSRQARPDRATIRSRVKELLALVQLDGLEKRYPSQLSGGQRQRVALARALAVDPKVLLLDEPFGALDAKVRRELRRWIRQLHHDIHITSIFVTHDQDEAMEVADRVVVMNLARIEQIGTPDEVYQDPANPFIFQFLGRAVTFRGDVRAGRLSFGDTSWELDRSGPSADGPAIVFARPEHIALADASNGSPGVDALIEDVNFAGPLVYLELQNRHDGSTFQLEVPADNRFKGRLRPGSAVHLNLKQYRVYPNPASPLV
jgi:sulfate/thiosulfate transport system ATP-binding protein